jgi:hypothetical protein
MPQLLHAGLQAALDRLAERHPAGVAAGSASAQQPSGTSQQPAPTPPYGPPITLEQAKRVMVAAELEAAKNSWQQARAAH